MHLSLVMDALTSLAYTFGAISVIVSSLIRVFGCPNIIDECSSSNTDLLSYPVGDTNEGLIPAVLACNRVRVVSKFKSVFYPSLF